MCLISGRHTYIGWVCAPRKLELAQVHQLQVLLLSLFNNFKLYIRRGDVLAKSTLLEPWSRLLEDSSPPFL